MQPNGGFVQHVQHAGGAVAHRAGQLHPLPLSGGKGGSGPVQGQISQAQFQQPAGHSLKGLADALCHGTHLLRQGGRHLAHPLHQLGKRHLAGLVQGDPLHQRSAGGRAQPCAAAIGTDILF